MVVVPMVVVMVPEYDGRQRDTKSERRTWSHRDSHRLRLRYIGVVIHLNGTAFFISIRAVRHIRRRTRHSTCHRIIITGTE